MLISKVSAEKYAVSKAKLQLQGAKENEICEILDAEFQFDRKKLKVFIKKQNGVSVCRLVRKLYEIFKMRIKILEVDDIPQFESYHQQYFALSQFPVIDDNDDNNVDSPTNRSLFLGSHQKQESTFESSNQRNINHSHSIQQQQNHLLTPALPSPSLSSPSIHSLNSFETSTIQQNLNLDSLQQETYQHFNTNPYPQLNLTINSVSHFNSAEELLSNSGINLLSDDFEPTPSTSAIPQVSSSNWETYQHRRYDLNDAEPVNYSTAQNNLFYQYQYDKPKQVQHELYQTELEDFDYDYQTNNSNPQLAETQPLSYGKYQNQHHQYYTSLTQSSIPKNNNPISLQNTHGPNVNRHYSQPTHYNSNFTNQRESQSSHYHNQRLQQQQQYYPQQHQPQTPNYQQYMPNLQRGTNNNVNNIKYHSPYSNPNTEFITSNNAHKPTTRTRKRPIESHNPNKGQNLKQALNEISSYYSFQQRGNYY